MYTQYNRSAKSTGPQQQQMVWSSCLSRWKPQERGESGHRSCLQSWAERVDDEAPRGNDVGGPDIHAVLDAADGGPCAAVAHAGYSSHRGEGRQDEGASLASRLRLYMQVSRLYARWG